MPEWRRADCVTTLTEREPASFHGLGLAPTLNNTQEGQ